VIFKYGTEAATKENSFYMYLQFWLPFTHYAKR